MFPTVILKMYLFWSFTYIEAMSFNFQDREIFISICLDEDWVLLWNISSLKKNFKMGEFHF